ncbi:type VII secretion protein EccCa [Streptomyces poonensis]|uniref:Type VII secretion protein EccC n=1 Tax=Streptomyces poonensis TaxID=68255 RepID=A0A918UWL0_9ACTN|nr:type VII secretion protein EccCa [Streptomyces poonensis]GGZ39128.1 type VII secretion protein EccC [Streptomyces poonensis]GLJ93125.1 type VII secretion protein EccC [Streptomyces poonensis]
MSVVIVKRPPRVFPPEVPSEEVKLESPPELPRNEDDSLLMNLLPMLGMGSSAAFFFMPGAQGFMKIMGMLMMASTVAMLVAQIVRARKGPSGQMAEARRDYLKYLAQKRREVRRTAHKQRDAQHYLHPAPEQLWALVAEGSRLWERRSTDPDFVQVRIGLGPQQLSTALIAPETAPVDELEPLTAHAMQQFIAGYGTVNELPLAIGLRSFYHVTVSGDSETVYGQTRSMLGQLASLHSPEDLVIAVVAAPGAAVDWEWTKWLPHMQHKESDGAGTRRLICFDLGELEEMIAQQLEGRPRWSRDGQPVLDQPHVVVVLDGGGVPADSVLASAEGLQGVTILEVVPGELDEARGSLSVRVYPDALELEAGTGVFTGTPDVLSQAQAESLARQLAPLRLGAADADEPLLANLDFTDLMQIGDAAGVDVSRTWRPRTLHERLRVPIGLGENGEPVMLDIKEASQEGMGPHGLCVGATGSGKSELLRTLVLGLAVTHSSETLNFVLADFKGGATFTGMGSMPHVSAVITNLADELTLVDRMRDSITGELTRRQELLRQAGNYANITDYEKARAAGAPLDPLPSLVLIIDEFSELLAAKPDFIEMFIQIGRIGRSLGVHMLLASQRLEEGKLRGLDTFLSYRIGLRTFSAAESRTAIGVPDAYHLPNVPGAGILKYGTESMVQFKAAYVSGTYRPNGPVVQGGGRIDRSPVLFTAAPVPVRILAEPEPETRPDQVDDALADTVLDVIVGRLEGQGPSAHQVWLPPLDEPFSLDQVLPALAISAERGLHAEGYQAQGKLVVPVGLVDKPFEQRRDVMYVDVSGSSGHTLIVGGPQSGKSTLVRTMIASFALTHTPAEVQFYALDFGGGGMLALENLAHVGGVASRLDQEKVRRTVAEVHGILNAREEFFRAKGVDSMATFRNRRAQGHYPDQHWGDVFLIIDGWATFKNDYEMLDAVIADIATRGLGFGIHLIVTATRYTEMRPALRDQILSRLELRLGDAMESEFDRKRAENVPVGKPGRGLSPDKLDYLAATPRLDGSTTVDDLADGMANLVANINNAWQGPQAPQVRMLPTMLPASELPSGGDFASRGIAIGVDELTLSPVFVDFETDPLFVIYGESESGKSSLLRFIAKQVSERYAPDKALFVVSDFRRALLGQVPESHMYKYCASGPQLQEVLESLAGSMSRRMPGPDVTPEQLRNRSWYSEPDAFIFIDDYDLVATSMGNPMSVLMEYLPFARDLGLRIILARTTSGASRSSFEPVLTRIKELGAQGIVLSGDPSEGPVFNNLKATPQPQGRGQFISRRTSGQLVQTGFLPES